MAYAKMMVSNGIEVKKVPLGFSWTMFFFGGFPPLFRGDWMWGIGMLVACALTSGFAGIIGAFFYNKMYAKSLFEKGYKVTELPAGYTEDHVKNYLGYAKLAMA